MNPGELEILLVEDNQDDMDLALHALRREKLANHIVVARDGEEALDFLFCRGAFVKRSFDQPPKLVLLDLKLPKVDGMEVLKQIKSDPRTRTIPVVIMTSSKEERDLAASYHLGANSYIQKPVDFDQFRETVKSVGLYWLVTNPSVPPNGLHDLATRADLASPDAKNLAELGSAARARASRPT
jgi:two-component system, response regulator